MSVMAIMYSCCIIREPGGGGGSYDELCSCFLSMIGPTKCLGSRGRRGKSLKPCAAEGIDIGG